MDVDASYEEYAARLARSCEDENIRKATRRAITSFRGNIRAAMTRFPSTVDKRRLARGIKEYSIAHMDDLVKEAKSSIEDAGGTCFVVGDASEALKRVDEVVGGDKLIVKSKSMTSEEIGLNEHLESMRNKVVETDIGEFIVQQLHEKPMHIIGPSMHVPRERVAEMLSRLLGRRIDPDIPLLVKTIRDVIRSSFLKADVGISGANSVVAETGTLVILENEGNARFATNAPPLHVAIAGLEKLVPTISDAMLVAEVTWRYASYKVPSYISLISGPSKTGDIEKVITYGVHGPKDLFVILMDNGRRKMASDPAYREALYCVKCGSCLFECPIYSVTSGHFGHKYFGGIGSIWTAWVVGGLEKALPMAYSCTLCGRCKDHCPMEIDVARLVQAFRTDVIKKGLVLSNLAKAKENINRVGNPFGLESPIEL